MFTASQQPKIYRRTFLQFFFAVLFAAFFSLTVNPSEAELLMGKPTLESEVLALREVNRKSRIDISLLVGKYIELGRSREVLTDFLSTIKDLKITIEKSPDAKSGMETLIASKLLEGRDRFSNKFGFQDELRIVVVLKNKEVLSVKGYVFFHSL